MSSCNFTTEILPSQCIGDSLITINTNFGNLDNNLCTVLQNLANTTDLLASAQANIRLSPSQSLPVVTNDTITSTIYLHPYKGNTVGLFNPSTNRWEIKSVPGVLSFSLAGLTANTNYDIYLYTNDGTNLLLDFVQWPSNLRGPGGPTRDILGGARVKQNQPARRFIGCMRTTTANTTEISFGRRWVIGGSHPKFFLWNAQHQTPAAFSIYDGAHWTVAGPGRDRAGWDGPFSNFGWRNVVTTGAGNRVSWISGDPVQVGMEQDHFQFGGWGYLTHALDLDQNDNVYVVDLHRQGQYVSEEQGQIIHQSNFVAPGGYHYVQSLVMSYNEVTYWVFEGPQSGGDSQYPGGRHSYGITGQISLI